MAELQGSSNVEESKSKIEQLTSQKQEKEKQLKMLSQTIKNLNMEASQRASFNLKKTQHKKKEEEYQTM